MNLKDKKLCEAISGRVYQYCKDIVSGKQVAGKYIKQAAKRFIKIYDGKDRKYFYSHYHGAYPIIWISRNFVHWMGKLRGEPVKLHMWQRFMICTVFGTLHKKTLKRRYQRVFVEIGKTSGKTPVVVLLMLYVLVNESLFGDQMRILSASHDQNGHISENLYQFIQLSKYKNKIRKTGSKKEGYTFKYLVKDASINTLSGHSYSGSNRQGLITSFLFADELADMATSNHIDALSPSTKLADNPLFFLATNAGVIGAAAPAYNERIQHIKALEGDKGKEIYASFMYEVDKKDEPRYDESCWPKSLPSLPEGYPTKEYVRSQIVQMPNHLVERLLFGIWNNAEAIWLSNEQWKSRYKKKLSSTEEERKLADLYLGIDLSTNDNLTSIAFLWDYGDRLELKTENYLPKAVVSDQEIRDHISYSTWEKDGYLICPPGLKIDPISIAERIIEVYQEYNLVGIGYDRHRFPPIIDTWSNKYPVHFDVALQPFWMPVNLAGFAGSRIKDSRKEFEDRTPAWINTAIDELETLVMSDKNVIEIEENPVFNMCANSARTILDKFNNRRIEKADARDKDDAVVASLMAAEARRVHKGSFFSNREIRSIDVNDIYSELGL